MKDTRPAALGPEPERTGHLPWRAAAAIEGVTTADVARRVWSLVADGLTFPELVERLRPEMDARVERVARDVAILLLRWHQERLLLWR